MTGCSRCVLRRRVSSSTSWRLPLCCPSRQCTAVSHRSVDIRLHSPRSSSRSLARSSLVWASGSASPANCRSLTVDAATVAATDCELCSLPPRPAHAFHVLLLTDSAAATWPARFSTDDTAPPLALCAAIDSAQRRILRAAAAATPAAGSASTQPRLLASVARITRHSQTTAALQSAARSQAQYRSSA